MKLICAQAKSALEAAPEYLNDLVDQSNNPNTGTLYQEALYAIGFNRKTVFNKFEDTFGKGFDNLTEDHISPPLFATWGGDKSHTFKVSDIEEKLALETMSNKAIQRSELPLQNIVRGLNTIMGDGWVQQNSNPVAPEKIITAWFTAIQVMQLQPTGNLALYTLFDNKVIYYLPTIYEKIVSFLEKLVKGNNQLSKPDKDIVAPQTDHEQDFGDIDNLSDIPDYSSFSSNGSGQTRTLSQIGSDNEQNQAVKIEPELNTDILVSALDKLQRDRELDDSDFYGSNYLMDLRGLLESFKVIPAGNVSPITIGQINDNVVDLTQLIFSFIMEDIHLPDDIRYHISRLQIAYLKLGLQDKSIFINNQHPARQLLNNLSQSIHLWQESHHGELDLLLSKIIKVIDQIIDEYHTNANLVTLIGEQFNHFLSGDEYIGEELLNGEEVKKSKTTKADNAHLYVEATLRELCRDKRIPPVVEQILGDFWAKVLFLEYLKSGDESKKYIDFKETVKMLVDSVQPMLSETKRNDLAKSIPAIVKRLKEGFETISITAFDTVEIFRELQECHLLALKEQPDSEADENAEVTEEDYQEFKQEQNIINQWDREELENALLEESIERSMAYPDSSSHAFDDNRNIITTKHHSTGDASIIRATREKEIIDNELKEARDAYELALKDHQKKKAAENGNSEKEEEADDLMTQIFQDPKYITKQYEGIRDLSSETDVHLHQEAEEESPEKEEDIFKSFEVEETANQSEDMDDTYLFTNYVDEEDDTDDMEMDEQNITQLKKQPHSNDDLDNRAHGALNKNFNELDDDKVVELVERLKVGLWVDLHQADGNQVRAKIMAIVPSVGKYIFGDRSENKLADYNRYSLTEALKTGIVRISEEDNIFDNTLESVISNLRILKKGKDD